MKSTFCTIITEDFYPMALTLYDSIEENGNASLNILIAAYKEKVSLKIQTNPKRIRVYFLDDIENFYITKEIYRKYFNTNIDSFRWSMKSVFMLFLLSICGYEKVIFVDPDIYFFDKYDFLFNILDKHNIILSPHWRPTNPKISPTGFIFNFKDGIFNGGFVGSNNKAIRVLEWWAEACLFKCEKDYENGLYVDQKYLDMFILFDDNIHILRHRGCNVANWNICECKRTVINNSTFINEKFPIIFIHFSPNTIKGILNGQDKYLKTYLEKYFENLKKNRFPYLSKWTSKTNEYEI